MSKLIRTFLNEVKNQSGAERKKRMRRKKTKGQLILKCLFGVFNFFQKTNENKLTWGIIVVKSNSFVRSSFFWRKRQLKKSFRLCLTFTSILVMGSITVGVMRQITLMGLHKPWDWFYALCMCENSTPGTHFLTKCREVETSNACLSAKIYKL